MKKNNNFLSWMIIALIIIITVALLLLKGCGVTSINLEKFGGSTASSNKYSSSDSVGGLIIERLDIDDESIEENISITYTGDGDIDFDCIDENIDAFIELFLYYFDMENPGLWDCYDSCDDFVYDYDDEEFGVMAHSLDLMDFLTIIPSVSAMIIDDAGWIVVDDINFTDEGDCFDYCDMTYFNESSLEVCFDVLVDLAVELECINRTVETAVFSGGDVDSVCSFYTTNFPLATSSLESSCNVRFGEFVCEDDIMACSDFMDFWGFIGRSFCDDAGVVSIGDVCDTIGYNWNCDDGVMSCE